MQKVSNGCDGCGYFGQACAFDKNGPSLERILFVSLPIHPPSPRFSVHEMSIDLSHSSWTYARLSGACWKTNPGSVRWPMSYDLICFWQVPAGTSTLKPPARLGSIHDARCCRIWREGKRRKDECQAFGPKQRLLSDGLQEMVMSCASARLSISWGVCASQMAFLFRQKTEA